MKGIQLTTDMRGDMTIIGGIHIIPLIIVLVDGLMILNTSH